MLAANPSHFIHRIIFSCWITLASCLTPLHGHKKLLITKKLHVVSSPCVVDLLLYRSPRIVVASCCLARDLVEVRGNSTQFLN